jgi:hypothetical protein
METTLAIYFEQQFSGEISNVLWLVTPKWKQLLQ